MGKEGREGEKHQCVVASHAPPTGDMAHNPGMCPDWELNWRPSGSQASAQCTEPHQPGGISFFDVIKIFRTVVMAACICEHIKNIELFILNM